MGNTCCGNKQGAMTNITVMTLNYCGIPSSPFDFYISDYQPQLAILGNIFTDVCNKELEGFQKDKKNANFGALQKNFKKGRYSPFFKKMAGVREIGDSYHQYKPMTQADFKSEWNKCFEQKKQNLFKKCKESPEDFQKHMIYLRNYDFLAYKAFIRYVYHQDLNQILKDKTFTLGKYMRVFEPFFDFSFLSQDNKLSKFRYGYRKTNPDLFFIQEYGAELIQFLEKKAKTNYFWFRDNNNENKEGQNLIIFKKDKQNKSHTFVGDPRQKFNTVDLKEVVVDLHEYKKGDESYKKLLAVQSPHFFIIAVHFTSREESNTPQIKYLNLLLKHLHDTQPYKNKTVIVGGDINSFQDEFQTGYNFFPQKEKDITTFKMRTAMQTQKKKIDMRVKKSIDKIITNCSINKGAIALIDGSQPDSYHQKEKRVKPTDQQLQENKKGMLSQIKMLLPCDAHPFDQFLIKTEVQVPNYLIRDQLQGMMQPQMKL